MAPEDEKRMDLMQSRASSPERGLQAAAPPRRSGNIAAPWFLMFLAAGFFWLLGLLMSLIIPTMVEQPLIKQ